MFVVKVNDRVVYGPKYWDKQEIQAFIYKNYDVEYPLPYANPSEKIYQINEEISIWPVIFRSHPEYDKKTQMLDGPFYEYNETHAHQYYTATDMNLEQCKNNLFAHYSEARKKFEEFGSAVSIGANLYNIDTRRSSRFNIQAGSAGIWKLQKITGDRDPDNGKYPTETSWIDLSDDDLVTLQNGVKAHVQKAFNAEHALRNQVQAVENIDELSSFPYTEMELFTYFSNYSD